MTAKDILLVFAVIFGLSVGMPWIFMSGVVDQKATKRLKALKKQVSLRERIWLYYAEPYLGPYRSMFRQLDTIRGIGILLMGAFGIACLGYRAGMLLAKSLENVGNALCVVAAVLFLVAAFQYRSVFPTSGDYN